MLLNTRIAVISGGLGNIGAAIAIALGIKGVKVAISDLREEGEVGTQLDEIRSAGCPDLFYTKVDITSELEVVDWLRAVESKWGIPQIIIPNAGIVVSGQLTGDDITTEAVQRQMAVNFWGCYHLAVQSAKKMKAAALPGRIVFIGSWAAERPHSRISSYCISKAAVRMLSKAMALELAADNILVNEIAPGIVEGGLSKLNQQKTPGLLEKHLDSTPVHKLVTAAEVAHYVVALADFSVDNMTGATIVVDGGLSLTSKMS